MRPLGPGAEVAPGIRVVAHLARSNHLDVYDAWCARRACRVVAKTLRPDRRDDAGKVRALLREGRLLVRLAHPHLVRGYEVHAGERPAVVLETLGGQTLAHLVATARRPLGAAELRHLGLHLAGALHYLHGEGVLHLDLKPSNVVAEAGRAKVIDLSVARPPGRMAAGRGTWCTMAPEQARGGEVGAAADVWGLGIVLFEAATGANPYADLGEEAEYPQLETPVPSLRSVRPRLDPALAALVDACLAPEPAARPGLGEVLGRLAGAAGA